MLKTPDKIQALQRKLYRRPSRRYPLIRPSKKAIKHISAEIKGITNRSNLSLPKDVVLSKRNEIVRGWTGYSYYQNCSEDLSSLKNCFEERVRTYLRRKCAKKHRGYRVYPYGYLYYVMGKVPTTVPWTQPAKASGRR